MNESVTFVQTSELEVIVTGNQHTVTFNDITEEPETNEQFQSKLKENQQTMWLKSRYINRC